MNSTPSSKLMGFAISLLLLTGCSAYERSPDRVVPEDWPGFALGLKAPKVKFLGLATIDLNGPAEDRGFLSRTGPSPRLTTLPVEDLRRRRSSSFRLMRYDTREEYRIVVDNGDLRRLGRSFRPRLGVEGPLEIAEIRDLVSLQPPLPTVTDGEDTRIRSSPTDVFPNSAIVFLTSLCTGALIAEDIVLTAAHCVVNGGLEEKPGYEVRYYDFTVIPGMDRNPECESGDEDASCRLAPFGEFAVEAVLVPDGWYEPKVSASDTARTYDPLDYADDIAVVRLAEPVPEEVGTFDYRSLPAEVLEGAALVNRGYPSPFQGPLPSGFEAWQLWGDKNYCFVEGFLGEVDRVHRIFRHGCDTSPGHSGSPIFQWRISLDQGWRPEIAGIMSHSYQDENYARRIVASDRLLVLGISFSLAP